MRQLEELKRFFTPSPDMDIILAFQGSFSQEVIVSLGDMLKNELSGIVNPGLVNKSFGIYVEMAQNIMHYSLEKKSGPASGIGNIMVARSAKTILIVTSNLISTTQMDEINRRVKEINKMDNQELKNVYLIKRKQQLKENTLGAGLGLLDIARRSTNQLGLGFLPEGMGKVRFFFRVIVNYK
jgi:hypothetical protein